MLTECQSKIKSNLIFKRNIKIEKDMSEKDGVN